MPLADATNAARSSQRPRPDSPPPPLFGRGTEPAKTQAPRAIRHRVSRHDLRDLFGEDDEASAVEKAAPTPLPARLDVGAVADKLRSDWRCPLATIVEHTAPTVPRRSQSIGKASSPPATPTSARFFGRRGGESIDGVLARTAAASPTTIARPAPAVAAPPPRTPEATKSWAGGEARRTLPRADPPALSSPVPPPLVCPFVPARSPLRETGARLFGRRSTVVAEAARAASSPAPPATPATPPNRTASYPGGLAGRLPRSPFARAAPTQTDSPVAKMPSPAAVLAALTPPSAPASSAAAPPVRRVRFAPSVVGGHDTVRGPVPRLAPDDAVALAAAAGVSAPDPTPRCHHGSRYPLDARGRCWRCLARSWACFVLCGTPVDDDDDDDDGSSFTGNDEGAWATESSSSSEDDDDKDCAGANGAVALSAAKDNGGGGAAAAGMTVLFRAVVTV